MVPVQEVLDIDAWGQMGFKHHPGPRSFAALRMTGGGPGQMGSWLLPDPRSFAALRMTGGRLGHKEAPRRRVTQLGSLITCVLIALLVSGLVLLLGPGSRASAMADNGAAGHVYVLNNDLSGSN